MKSDGGSVVATVVLIGLVLLVWVLVERMVSR